MSKQWDFLFFSCTLLWGYNRKVVYKYFKQTNIDGHVTSKRLNLSTWDLCGFPVMTASWISKLYIDLATSACRTSVSTFPVGRDSCCAHMCYPYELLYGCSEIWHVGKHCSPVFSQGGVWSSPHTAFSAQQELKLYYVLFSSHLNV